MDWLRDNWLYLLLMFAVVALVARRGGLGCGMPDMGRHGPMGTDAGSRIDPVSGDPVSGDGAAVASHQGRLYYFNSRENRDRFEADPSRFVPQDANMDHRHERGGHGCC